MGEVLVDCREFYALLTEMTRRLQAGGVVADVLQDTLGQLQQGWGVQHLALYRNEQLVLSSGGTFYPGQLPDTWRVEKRSNTNGETWFYPVTVQQQRWGWLVAHWLVSPAESIIAQGKLFTAHLGLVISTTGWDYQSKSECSLATLTDELYHFLLNVLPIGVALRNLAGDFIYVNEYLAEQLFQMPPHELLGSGWMTILHPEDRGRVIQSWLGRTHYSFFQKEEYRLKRQNGSVIYLREQIIALTNPNGETLGFIAIFTDITEEKALQFILTKNEEQYRQIVECQADFLGYSLLDQIKSVLAEKQKLLDNVLNNLPVAVCRYQLWLDGREALLYVSAGCEKVYGVTAEEAIQNIPKLWNLLIPEDLPYLKQLMQQSAQNLSIIETEFRIRTPQGQMKWLRIYGQPERQADGSTIWDSVFLDITSKKEAQLALQTLNQELEQRIHDRTIILQKQAQKEGLLRLIIETIHQAVSIEQMLQVVLDSTRTNLACDRVVVYKFNPDWTGYFLAESVAPGWVSVVTAPLTTLSDHCLEETQGGRFQQHYILVSNDIYQSGFTPCHIELLEKFQARAFVITPVFLENKLWGLLAAYQNSGSRIWQTDEIDFLQHIGLHLAIALRQSELYQAAQAQVVELQKLNKLKDEFLSTVSHELRSPMHNIKMGLKMLELKLQKSGILADTELGISRYLDILKSSTERETNLINDLLDLARLTADELTLELTQVDVREVLDKILPPIEERTQTQNQGFTVQLPTEFCPLYTHQHSLERILQELLHNACKYTPAGETITLSIGRESERFCCFRVINTGVDIPPVEQERVFDNFYRIPTHDPWQYGGTGLGLALVKKLVERLGGTIRLTSENKRTEFAVRLPISCPAEGTMTPTHQLSDDSLAS